MSDSESTVPSARRPPEPSRSSQPESRYTSGSELARGGVGAIHAVHDRLIGRTVAKKVLLPEAQRQGLTRAFIEEAQITGQLEHPHIVPVYDVLVDPRSSESAFTMRLVHGRTLHERIREHHERPFDARGLEQLLRVMIVVCDTVSYAHQRGVTHRDLKPQNVMTGPYGQIYVMDWGAALVRDPPTDALPGVVGPRSTEPDLIVGTPAYMAPEQRCGGVADIAAHTDVFGIGAMLYEILTGAPPCVCEQDPSQAPAIEDPRQRCPDRPMPAGLCEIAMRALRPDPSQRYPSVDAVRDALDDFLRGGGWFASRTFAAGEVIVHEGEDGDESYVIVAGRCVVSRGEGPARVEIATLGPGEAFGELSLVVGGPRTASVIALEPTTVKVVSRATFERELEDNRLVHTLVKQLAKRFVEIEDT